MTIDQTPEMVDFETAVGDPAAYYTGPQDIVADAMLDKAQKLRFLAEWAQDLADRQRSAGEGMAPEDNKAADMDVKQIREVAAAIEQVEASEEAAISAPRSFWSRLRQLAG